MRCDTGLRPKSPCGHVFAAFLPIFALFALSLITFTSLTACQPTVARQIVEFDFAPVAEFRRFSLLGGADCPEDYICLAAAGYDLNSPPAPIVLSDFESHDAVYVETDADGAAIIHVFNHTIIEGEDVDLGTDTVIKTHGRDIKIVAARLFVGAIDTTDDDGGAAGDVVVIAEELRLSAVEAGVRELPCAPFEPPPDAAGEVTAGGDVILRQYKDGGLFKWFEFHGVCDDPLAVAYRLSLEAGAGGGAPTLVATLIGASDVELPPPACEVTLIPDHARYESMISDYDARLIEDKTPRAGRVRVYTTTLSDLSDARIKVDMPPEPWRCPGHHVLSSSEAPMYAEMAVPAAVFVQPREAEDLSDLDGETWSLAFLRSISADWASARYEADVPWRRPIWIVNRACVDPYMRGRDRMIAAPQRRDSTAMVRAFEESAWAEVLPGIIEQERVVTAP